jgi:NitT/TauT family transport system substrate-binding protein
MKRHVAVLLCAATLVGLGAASASTAQPAKPTAPKADDVKVGLAALWISAPIYVAIHQGFFKKYNLNVTPTVLASTPAMVAAAKAGAIQFGVGALSTEFQAHAQGLGLKIVSPNSALSTKLEGIAVAADSSIRTLKDLAGKTYCINILNGQAQGQAKWALKAAGVDMNSVRFIGIPFAEAVAALQAHRVDACQVVQPYLTPAVNAGQIRVIGDDTKIFGPAGSAATAYFATRTYASRNGPILTRFVKAMTDTHKYIAGHPGSVTAVLPEYTGVTPAQASATAVGTFPTVFNIKNLQLAADRLVEVGLVGRKINVSTALWKGAPRVTGKKKQ